MHELEGLNRYLSDFLGYGSETPNYIFVGMEEGGGESLDNISTRLKVWPKYGQKALVPLREFSIDLGFSDFFKEKPKSQPTWRALIKILLSLKGEDLSLNTIKEFQKIKLGSENSDHAIIELMPLPSPSTKDWPYENLADYPILRTRELYFNKLLEERISLLKKFILTSKPKVVVFYGYTYREHWEKVCDLDLREIQPNDFLYGTDSKIHYLVTKHPASFIKKDYFEGIGLFLESLF